MKWWMNARRYYWVVLLGSLAGSAVLLFIDGKFTFPEWSAFGLMVLAMLGFAGILAHCLRKDHQAQRKFSEDILNQYFIYSNDMLCVADHTGYFKLLNPEWEKVLGFSQAELMEEPYISFVHPDDVESTLKAASDLSGQTQLYDFVNRYRCKDGSYRWLEWHSYPKDDLVFAAVRDITEFKNAQKVIADERNMLRALVDTIPDIVYVKDTESRFLLTNNTLADILGRTVEDILGKTDLELFPQELSQHFYADERSVVLSGKSILNKEETIYDTSGNPVIILTNKLPLHDSNGNVMGIVGSGHMITERKKAEEEIRILNKELGKKVAERTARLQQAYNELESFAYSISHDLRAPLRHIDGFVRLMQAQIPSPSETVTDYADKILAASKRMTGMIDDLLLFSRLGRKELVMSQVNLNTLVAEIVDHFHPEINGRDLSWEIHQLPTIRGDQNLLRQAFENLLANAIKYTSGKSKAKIEMGTVTLPDGKQEIFIRDNGIGFDMAYAGKLFGLFQRLHSGREFEGTGIGLANVKQIITKHNGRIRAEAKTNEGATFFISFPRHTLVKN